jgi:hypothetical protein
MERSVGAGSDNTPPDRSMTVERQVAAQMVSEARAGLGGEGRCWRRGVSVGSGAGSPHTRLFFQLGDGRSSAAFILWGLIELLHVGTRFQKI